MNHVVTIFKNITTTSTGFNRSVEFVADRIRKGNSAKLIAQIQAEPLREKQQELKKGLPSICFSGTFKHRAKAGLIAHSGLICLDFDKIPHEEMQAWRDTLSGWEHTYILFVSPSGNGFKVVVKIPADHEKHQNYFDAIAENWKDCEYFDTGVGDFSRVCYESYDPDIYVNNDALPWLTINEPEEEELGSDDPAIKVTSESEIIARLDTWYNRKFAGQSRNDSLYRFANALNSFGVPHAQAERHLLQYTSSAGGVKNKEPFTESEIVALVKSAYKKRDRHHTRYFEDTRKKAAIEKMIRNGKGVKEVANAFPEIATEVESAVQEVKDTISITDFWTYNDKGKVVLSPHKYKFFLEQNQFCKFFPEGSAAYLFVRINSNLLEDTAAAYIKDFVLSYLLERADIGYAPYDFMANQTRLFKDDYLSMLDTAEVRLKKDTDDTCYLYYQNCAVEVGRDTVNTIDYLDLDGFVWKKHVIDREFKGVGNDGGMFEKFLRLAAGKDEKRFNSLRSVAGYLLHSYKTSANNKAIIMNDELISENPNGGSGKGMFCNAIGQMKRTATLDGKQFSFEKSFPYQTVGADTQVLVFDDVKKNFAFEQLFSLITEGITLEKKNKDAIHIPVHRSPKLVITTNYTIGGIGGSFERRKFEVEFSSYFGAHRTPFDEFGCMLFDEWSEEEWARFDSFMIGCVQYYLNNGLVAHESVNLELRKFIKETSSEFVEWATLENLPLRQRLDKTAMFTAFISEYKDYERTLSQKRFTQWMDIYGKKNGYKVTQGKSHVRWIHFDDGNGPNDNTGLDLSSDEIDPLA